MKPKMPTADDLPKLGWICTGEHVWPGKTQLGEPYAHRKAVYWRKGEDEIPEFLAIALESWKAGFWKGKHVRGQSAVRNSTEATS